MAQCDMAGQPLLPQVGHIENGQCPLRISEFGLPSDLGFRASGFPTRAYVSGDSAKESQHSGHFRFGR
jgi:hypothetical protein